ncbi:hypothetical protein H310_04383 [Aphanomyces invadans]|uniref:Uncharacterized protein n=1 Tax=Aphanomyces invadans TaxID=157072 RepID=A0A024UCQ2_9STRA|nr:hypothetical protein H310_04383 [Aphanomyces invadans]ETW03975.1 hypothetical protein H310_04383 [Aphanomyces invadans]|eukprot:XP_008866931.1 hypothetical protein H310_04383 [Aphanomyces invadans]
MMHDDAVEAMADLSVHAHELLKEAAKWTSAVTVTLSKLRAASASSRQQGSNDVTAEGTRTDSLELENAALRERNALLTESMRMIEARVQREVARTSRLAAAHHKLSVKYMRAKQERNTAVVRFWNWVAGQVSVVGLEHVAALIEAWEQECRWTCRATCAPSVRLDEFKTSTGVFALTTAPATAPASLPIPEWQPFETDDDEADSNESGDDRGQPDDEKNDDVDPEPTPDPPTSHGARTSEKGEADSHKRNHLDETTAEVAPTKRHCSDATAAAMQPMQTKINNAPLYLGPSAVDRSDSGPSQLSLAQITELPALEKAQPPIVSPAPVQPAPVPPTTMQQVSATPQAPDTQVCTSHEALGAPFPSAATSFASPPGCVVTTATGGLSPPRSTAIEYDAAPALTSAPEASLVVPKSPAPQRAKSVKFAIPAALPPSSSGRLAPASNQAPAMTTPQNPASAEAVSPSKKRSGSNVKAFAFQTHATTQASATGRRASLGSSPIANPARSIRRQVPATCPGSITAMLAAIRETKPWLKYMAVASFLPDVDPMRSDRATTIAHTFNRCLRDFWTKSAALLWECRFSWAPNTVALDALGDNVILLMGQFQRLVESSEYGNELVEFVGAYPHPAWPVMTSSFMPLNAIYRMHGKKAVLSFLQTQGHKMWPEYPPIQQVELSAPPIPVRRRHSTATTTLDMTLPASIEWRCAFGATFSYAANRTLTTNQLDALSHLGLREDPTASFRRMVNTVKAFVKDKFPHPSSPYPFVTVTVEGHPIGPQWTHGIHCPPTKFAHTVPAGWTHPQHLTNLLLRLVDDDSSDDDVDRSHGVAPNQRKKGTSTRTAIAIENSSDSSDGDSDDGSSTSSPSTSESDC